MNIGYPDLSSEAKAKVERAAELAHRVRDRERGLRADIFRRAFVQFDPMGRDHVDVEEFYAAEIDTAANMQSWALQAHAPFNDLVDQLWRICKHWAEPKEPPPKREFFRMGQWVQTELRMLEAKHHEIFEKVKAEMDAEKS